MRFRLALALAGTLLWTTAGWAQLFSESFDSAAANVKVNAQSDTAFDFVDYSAFGIPEAPRSTSGSATSGIKLEGNLSVGSAAGVNVLAGSTPIAFSGNYRVSFDSWQNLNINPFPGGSTEQLLWGVGSDDANVIEARNTRNDGTAGTWGWLAGENGYGTEDTAIFENGVELADLGDTQTFEDVNFNLAFPCHADGNPTTGDAEPPNGAPINDWVQVDIDVLDNGDGTSNVAVYYNFVEFFSETVDTASASGFALLGYEDPFGSVNSDPANTFGIFDNFVVTADPSGVPTGVIPHPNGCAVPEPDSGLISLLGLIGFLAIRRK